jgi:hypothetical protein
VNVIEHRYDLVISTAAARSIEGEQVERRTLHFKRRGVISPTFCIHSPRCDYRTCLSLRIRAHSQ